MSRSRFDTGEEHQKRAAVWIRRRLVDQKGVFRAGSRRVPQRGVILADGVGLGKTWEALAASALLLVERSKQTRIGRKSQRHRRRLAKILVLCPPGLVSKWTREIRDPEGFRSRLECWMKKQPRRREFVHDTLTQPYEIQRTRDLEELRPTRKRKMIHLTEGIYLCNWNVVQRQVGAGNSRLAALRSQRWDVVIVDEAHHRESQKALKAILTRSSVGNVLLLTATPFQLDPKELHPLLGTIVERTHEDHKVLVRPPVSRFVRSLDRFFRGGDAPARAEKRDAERHLRQLIVRNQTANKGRRYFAIDERGLTHELVPPPDRRNEHDLEEMTQLLIRPHERFESWYIRRRLELADGIDRTCVPTKLRQALSTRSQAQDPDLNSGSRPPSSPRTDALLAWASRQIELDLTQFIEDGLPRKILVFSSYVSKAANELRRAMEKTAIEAWHTIRESRKWEQMSRCAATNLRIAQRAIERGINEMIPSHDLSPHARTIVDNIQELVSHLVKQKKDSFLRDLFGHPTFRKLVVKDLLHQLDVIRNVASEERELRWQERLRRYELRRLGAVLQAQRSCCIASTYAGNDDRREREAAGEAFRSPLGPWALIASNVGSEGIDLQTFSAHLVHFDIEWNPARMEQREGRIDRVGRQLKDHVNVYFLLVRGTYDERMLHQLVARQRWHSVLLGRAAAKLTKDHDGVKDPQLLDAAESRKWTIDLRPSR